MYPQLWARQAQCEGEIIHMIYTRYTHDIHKLSIHRPGQGSYSSPCASQARAPFAPDGRRFAPFAVAGCARPRPWARLGGLKVRTPKIFAAPRKIVGGLRQKLRWMADDIFRSTFINSLSRSAWFSLTFERTPSGKDYYYFYYLLDKTAFW